MTQNFKEFLDMDWKSILNFIPDSFRQLLGVYRNYGQSVPVFGDLLGKYAGTNLTSSEREQNAFNASEAEKQRSWTEHLDNTKYQRAVQDMQAAGLNPALMYGSAGVSSAPSGAAASSGSVSSGSLSDIVNLALLPFTIRQMEAQTNKTNVEATQEIPARVQQLLASSGSLKAQIRNMDLDSDSKEIMLKYLDQQQNFYTLSLGLSNEKIQQEIAESVQRVENLKEQNKEIVQRIVESKQRVRVLMQEESLTAEQVKEVRENIEKIKADTEYIKKNTTLTQKDIDWYAANHIIGPASNVLGDVIGSGSKVLGKVVGKGKKIKDPYGRLTYMAGER